MHDSEPRPKHLKAANPGTTWTLITSYHVLVVSFEVMSSSFMISDIFKESTFTNLSFLSRGPHCWRQSILFSSVSILASLCTLIRCRIEIVRASTSRSDLNKQSVWFQVAFWRRKSRVSTALGFRAPRNHARQLPWNVADFGFLSQIYLQVDNLVDAAT